MKDVGVNGGDGAGQEDEKEEVIKSGNTCEVEVEPRMGGGLYIEGIFKYQVHPAGYKYPPMTKSSFT